MAATGFFGEGLAETLLEKFIENFPKWLYAEISEDDIIKIHGFGRINSEKIAQGLEKFKEWYWDHPMFYHLSSEEKEIDPKTQDLIGEVIVFTGFRDDILKHSLEQRGAKVSDSFLKATTLVVASDVNKTSDKIRKAKDKGIKIISKKSFLDNIKNGLY